MKDVIVRVPTKEDWIDVVNTILGKGYVWQTGDTYTKEDNWQDYKEDSCISIISERMGYCNERSYEKIYSNIPIVTAQEFLEEEIEYGAKDRKVAKEMGEYIGNLCDSPVFIDYNLTGGTISQPNKTMNKLKPMTKRLLDKDTQTLCKAGYINGDLELTENGRNALNTILFTANKAELVKMAQEELDEEE